MSCHLFKPRKILLFSFFLVSISVGILFFAKDNLAYDHLSRKIFHQELSDNTLTLHYTLKEPRKYGIRQANAVLPVYTKENRLMSNERCKEYLKQLNQIDNDKLTASRKYNHTLTTRFFTLQNELNRFPYYEEPCTPGSGMQTTLPILFSEYRFYDKHDIINYLSLLSQLDEYLVSLAVYETEKEAAGLFMSDQSAEEVIHECLNYVELSKHLDSHFLISSFEERLTKFCTDNPNKLSEEEFSSFCLQNKELIEHQLPQGYQKLADTFSLLKGKKPERQGLGITENGKEYYRLLLCKNTGSYLKTDAIEQLLFHQFDELCEKLREIDPVKNTIAVNTPKMTAEEMLSKLQKEMSADYPALPQKPSDAETPYCDIKYIDDALADYCAPAFYLVPPIDDYDTNTIYINPQNSKSGLSLFTTLAHEGFPGHLYQTVYAHRSRLYSSTDPMRSIMNYEGYCEGWALYVELESYRYAGKYYPTCIELQQISRSLDLCLCSLLDFQIHYRNMSEEQVIAFLDSLGIPKETAKSLYGYIINEPTTYLKYYLSYLEICSLKEAAKQKWGNDYSDYKFHKFYLDSGPSDFATLYEHL